MTNSITRNNHIYNSTNGITVAESQNNQIYNNTIEGATSQGIRLYNPSEPDDGFTESNLVYNNTIISSENAIVAIRSHDNILENNRFSELEESEFRLLEDSSMIIRGQHFEDTLISHRDSDTDGTSHIEIVDSGIIEVTEEGAIEEGAEDNEELYNTDIEPYRKALSDGDIITVNSL